MSQRSGVHFESMSASTARPSMVDSRTWEMYRRITEARKRNSSYASQQAAGAAGKHAGCDHQESASDWENMNHDFGLDGSNTPDGHEMIFLFDFE